MSGTEWTEPGKGASIGELDDALRDVLGAARRNKGIHVSDLTVAFRALLNLPRDAPDCTNLRLTGEPLTVEDVRRIAEAK